MCLAIVAFAAHPDYLVLLLIPKYDKHLCKYQNIGIKSDIKYLEQDM